MTTVLCAECKNPRRPIMYRIDGEAFCCHKCYVAWWSKQSQLSAQSRGLCPKCWTKHKPKEPHAGWIVKPES